jgi:hypothetical protein
MAILWRDKYDKVKSNLGLALGRFKSSSLRQLVFTTFTQFCVENIIAESISLAQTWLMRFTFCNNPRKVVIHLNVVACVYHYVGPDIQPFQVSFMIEIVNHHTYLN